MSAKTGTITFQQNDIAAPKVGSFEILVSDLKFLGLLFHATDATVALDKILKEQMEIYKGDAVINLSIKYQYTFVELLVNYITAGLVNPSSAVIRGDVVKIK